PSPPPGTSRLPRPGSEVLGTATPRHLLPRHRGDRAPTGGRRRNLPARRTGPDHHGTAAAPLGEHLRISHRRTRRVADAAPGPGRTRCTRPRRGPAATSGSPEGGRSNGAPAPSGPP